MIRALEASQPRPSCVVSVRWSAAQGMSGCPSSEVQVTSFAVTLIHSLTHTLGTRSRHVIIQRANPYFCLSVDGHESWKSMNGITINLRSQRVDLVEEMEKKCHISLAGEEVVSRLD